MDIQEINRIEKDIKDLNIQGATNVAIATLEGMKIYINKSRVSDGSIFFNEFFEVGNTLANARLNEPLARNGVKYVKHFYNLERNVLPDMVSMKRLLWDKCDEYLGLIERSKKSIINECTPYIQFYENVLTHCHSSTAVEVIKSIAKGKDSFDVVCTETRPLFQGRKTAKSLLDAGISTTMIADSAVESFVIGRGSVKIDAVFIGCDQISMKGHCINKIGSWGIGMSAYYSSKPLYVVSPLLKIDPSISKEGIVIEVREDKEIWPEAPSDLDLFNPAFEIVDNNLITAFLTEFGIIKPEDISRVVSEKYPWLFES